MTPHPHRLGVYPRYNFPERGLPPSGYALERQSSLGEVITSVHPTRLSYLYDGHQPLIAGSKQNLDSKGKKCYGLLIQPP